MTDAEKVELLKKEIGERLKALRLARRETQQQVADRVKDAKSAKGSKGYISDIEKGLVSPALDKLCELILVGLKSDFSEFCRYWVTEDKDRERQERTARELLEKVLGQGREDRAATISLLTELAEGGKRSSKRGR